ncbi:MAG: DUF502 domain-containing protein [Bacteroidales bacterium]|nr:DUF502 domain-containing protein [Bacteroidales bacterium]
MKRLLSYLGQGLLIVAPVVVTGYIVYLIFNLLDSIMREQITRWIGFTIPGLGFIMVILFLILLGWVGQTLIGRPVKKLFERVIRRTPVFNIVYSAINDIFKALVGKDKKFDFPVVALMNRENNIWKMGFVTQTDMSSIGMPGMVTVYMPHSYNFSGEHFIIPSENVRPLEISASDAMKFIVSGGIASYNAIARQQAP